MRFAEHDGDLTRRVRAAASASSVMTLADWSGVSHWNSARSSPTSPTTAITRFLGRGTAPSRGRISGPCALSTDATVVRQLICNSGPFSATPDDDVPAGPADDPGAPRKSPGVAFGAVGRSRGVPRRPAPGLACGRVGRAAVLTRFRGPGLAVLRPNATTCRACGGYVWCASAAY